MITSLLIIVLLEKKNFSFSFFLLIICNINSIFLKVNIFKLLVSLFRQKILIIMVLPFSRLSILIKFYVNVSGSNLYISFFYLYIKNLKITKNGNEIISLVKEEINNIILMSVKT